MFRTVRRGIFGGFLRRIFDFFGFSRNIIIKDFVLCGVFMDFVNYGKQP